MENRGSGKWSKKKNATPQTLGGTPQRLEWNPLSFAVLRCSFAPRRRCPLIFSFTVKKENGKRENIVTA